MSKTKFANLTEFKKYIAGRSNIHNKNDVILSLCRNAKTLDLGCIDHSYKTALELGERWLHRQISEVSSELIGLDILAEDARVLNEKGFNIKHGDAEDFDLQSKFQVIIAGDLIEHLSNVGNFLDSVCKHMDGESKFVITTPNAFNVEQVWQAVFNRSVVVNTQHTQWLDPITMWQVLNRHHLTVTDFYWIETRFKNYIWSSRWRYIVNRITDLANRRVPLLRRDFAVVCELY